MMICQWQFLLKNPFVLKKACHIRSTFFSTPKLLKLKLILWPQIFKSFFPLNHAYLWKSHACCSLVYARLKFCLLKQNILSFCRSFAGLRTGGKLFLEGRFYFIVFLFSLTTCRIFKVSKSRLRFSLSELKNYGTCTVFFPMQVFGLLCILLKEIRLSIFPLAEKYTLLVPS